MNFIDLARQQLRIKSRIDARIQNVLSHGKFIAGPEVGELERKLAEYSGAKNVISCANGTDALELSLMALGISSGDAVFCPSFTFAATAEAVPRTGAIPLLCDIDPQTYNLCTKSLIRTARFARDDLGLTPRAVIAVDLFGLPADYEALRAVCNDFNMHLISDSAQSFGSRYQGKRSGTLGDITTTSFFPAKPLGCYGDGGAIFTDNPLLADLIRSLAFHGRGNDKYDNVRIGMNSRLDTLQAAILIEKLSIFDEELSSRNMIAKRYTDGIGEIINTPIVKQDSYCSWAQYTVRCETSSQREFIQKTLLEAEIPSIIYYSRALHKQTAYADFPQDPYGLEHSENASETVLSLPMHPYLNIEEQDFIISTLIKGEKNFRKNY